MTDKEISATGETICRALGLHRAVPCEECKEIKVFVANAVLAERERCARIADSMRDKTYWDDPVAGISAKIREGTS